MRRSISLLLLLVCTLAWSRDPLVRRDTLKVDFQLESSRGTNDDLQPLWSYSREWGRYTQYKSSEAIAYAKVQYGWTSRKGYFSIKGGVAGEFSTDGKQGYLHEAYVSGNIWKINYTVGREAYTPITQCGKLGIGSFIMSDNARPYTRAGAGFFNYWAIPGIKNWIEIKGGLYVGQMPDEGSELYTKKALLHEKFAYLRIGRFPVKPYLGLVHSVAMGGTLADGTEVPIDFWASFLGRGSEKLRDAGFSGEYFDPAGGHQGLWDLGFDLDFDDFGASLYYRRPFYDAQTMYLKDFAKCRDFHLGFDLNLKKSKFVRHLNFEYLTTVWQGGLGLNDPFFISTGPVNTGEIIYMSINKFTIDDIPKYFAPEMIREWEAEHGPLRPEHKSDFLIKYANGGRPWGDNTPFLMNAMYPQGWTSHGLSMGYPIFMTDEVMETIDSDFSSVCRFANIRMMALNFGIEGNFSPQFSYRAKCTYVNNYGNLRDQYDYDVYTKEFTPVEGYYFSRCKTEIYTGLWLDYRLKCFTFTGAFACDFGQMYNSFSARFGVKIALDCIPFRKKEKK